MNNVALVTGTTSGIGYALCEKFAKEGTDIVLVSRNKEKLASQQEYLQKTYGIKVWTIRRDLGTPGAAQLIYNDLCALNVTVEYLVNNAGFDRSGRFVETDLDKEMEMMQLNAVFVTELTKLVLPDMVRRKSGRILFLGSVASYVPCALNAVYSATKAYVLFFSRAIRTELKGTGVTVTVLCPGATKTEFAERSGLDGTPSFNRFVMSAEKVADAGYKSMMKGRIKHTPGVLNKFMIFASKVLPASVVDGFTMRMFTK
jgi:short-subunit dehydrogenase